jgi:hypothetical protein
VPCWPGDGHGRVGGQDRLVQVPQARSRLDASQDLLVDIAQLRAGLDAQFIDENPACPLIGIQCLSPPPGTRQREHELGVEPFS